MGDVLWLGGAVAALILASLGLVYLNHTRSSTLETNTYALVRQKETEVIDHALLSFLKSLPANQESLSQDQRGQLSEIIDVYTGLEVLNQKVLSIGTGVSRSMILALPAAIFVALAGYLYELPSAFYAVSAMVAFVLGAGYFVLGIFPATRIRAVELSNRNLLEAHEVSKLKEIVNELLKSQFGIPYRQFS